MSDQNLKKQFERNDTELPVLALREDVIFPGMSYSFPVGREESKAALKAATERHNGKLILVTQKNAEKENVEIDDLYDVGVIVNVLSLDENPDGSLKVAVKATDDKVSIDTLAFEENEGYYKATSTVSEFEDDLPNLIAAQNLAKEACIKYAEAKGVLDENTKKQFMALEDTDSLIFNMMLFLKDALTIEQRQQLLETESKATIFESLFAQFEEQNDIAKIEKKIKTRVKSQMEKHQREFYLNQQMKAIQEELGEGEEGEADELEELAKHFESETIPEHVRERAQKEIKKLKKMNPMQADYNVIRTYLDVLRDIPWGVKSEVNNDLVAARAALEEDHYGLEKVKDNVIKHLAVQKRLKAKGLEDVAEAKIMCMVGPPGVGKTSIAQSLAKSTGREYVRIALGGVRDEAELRGHRRTYVGAKPGKIVSHLIKAGTMNPLFVLDEIDKMGADQQRGDPASAMLEILDPEQNNSFEDHYLDLEMDLSDIMFYCTANVFANIPGPLQDRMEVEFLGSYMPDEKLEIAKQHLVRKQMKATGLDQNEFSITDNALKTIIASYTLEAGVRNLKRIIGQVCIEAVMKIESESVTSVHVTEDMLEDMLGPEQFSGHQTKDEHKIGTVAGLAYTSVGGKPLFIETVQFPSKSEAITVTGNLRDVMKESIQYAVSYLKAYGEKLGLQENAFEGKTIHLHCPVAAVPKDGPSAGAAMLTAIFSQVTGQKISKDVAMTGEINLNGEVTAIGGLKEKLTGAAAAGFKTVLIPKDNEKDLHEVPEQVRAKLEIIPVDNVQTVLEHAIVDYKKAQPAPK